MAIHVMDEMLRTRIAAGEVIERPASVVKELLENAIDAGARQVRVDLEGGGIDLIRVVDNGSGIAPDEVSLAFERHATSKLAAFDDLFALQTLGFRGEALPSIAAIATVEMATRVASVPAGVLARLEGGRIVQADPHGLPVGTTVVVRDLFADVPARRKFLKSRAGEVASVQATCMALALANPDVALALWSDGRLLFSTPGSGRVQDVLAIQLGPAVGLQLWEVDWPDVAATRAEHGPSPVRSVHGAISAPGVDRLTRIHQTFVINGRWVRNRVLGIALEEGYHTHVMVGRHPIAVLFLDIDPAALDVNVHPAKSEIKFLDERAVFGAIRRAVNETLNRHAPVFPASTLTGERDDVLAFEEAAEPVQGPLWATATVERIAPILSPTADGGQRLAVAHLAPTAPPPDRLPVLRVLGQANNLFIIAEGPDGVYMVDQHAAHERILFDDLVRLANSAEGAVQTQMLLAPVVIDLDPVQIDVLRSSSGMATVARLGFMVEPLDGGACLVRGVPAPLAGEDVRAALESLLAAMSEGGDAPDWRDRALATMACKSAVKAGQPLTMDEMRRLIMRLETTTRPRTCPHGRPTLILLSQSRLEREFGRHT